MPEAYSPLSIEERAHRMERLLRALAYGYGPAQEPLNGTDWLDFCAGYMDDIDEVLGLARPEYEGDDPAFDGERAKYWGY